MKKILAIILSLILVGTGLFAATPDLSEGPSKVHVKSVVGEFIGFGVSSAKLLPEDFVSLETYLNKANSSIDTTVSMLDLGSETLVGFVSGVNNSKKTISLYLSVTPLTSGTDKVGLHVRPNYTAIPPASDSRFGVLQGTLISVIETTKGAAVRAPAGTYTATVTIRLTFEG